jgi:hypothetical protein
MDRSRIRPDGSRSGWILRPRLAALRVCAAGRAGRADGRDGGTTFDPGDSKEDNRFDRQGRAIPVPGWSVR